MAFPQAEGQMGFPPRVATDAQRGYSVATYRSAGALPSSCRRNGSILVSLEGSCARPHPGAKNILAQRPRVGYCPCCSKATDTAAPARYNVGEFSNKEARGLIL